MTQDTTPELQPESTPTVTPNVAAESQKKDETPKYQEGQVLSINYTVAGPVRVVWRGGKQVIESPVPSEDATIPGGLRGKTLESFMRYCMLYDASLRQKDRKVPLLLKEAASVVDRASLKSLSRKGLVNIETLYMVNDQKEKFSHAFIWPTPLGLALREIIRREQTSVTEEANETLPENIEAPVEAAVPQETATP